VKLALFGLRLKEKFYTSMTLVYVHQWVRGAIGGGIKSE
jgi:hypothetical protein